MNLRFLYIILFTLVSTTACQETSNADHAASADSPQHEAPLPPDAIGEIKPLIKGRLYKEASLEQGSVIAFDTSQQIYILDTTNTLFIKARIVRDTTTYTGYVLKAILPE